VSCPSVEELLAGDGAEHAAGCAGCTAILALAATRVMPLPCGRAEAFMAARAAGSLARETEIVLLRHLETCADCRRVAGELEASVVADVFDGAAETESDFTELSVVAADNYVRGKEIGRGGMGRIVFARDRRLGRAVAIKELLDASLQARFEREARLTARLQHPAIVSVHEAGRWPSGDSFYAMKYVAGRPLHQVIAEKATLPERLALLAHFTTVAEAIAYAHSEGVIHRDLKPQNILIGAFGETVVIDWGLAKDLREAGAAESTSPYRIGASFTLAGAGTPAYMAPEQARGEEPDEGVDIYGLGATLHHLLSGGPPRQAPLPIEAPAELRAIVGKATAPARSDRYRTAAELADELNRFQTGQLVSAHRYSIRDLAGRWLRRHRTRLFAVAALAAAIGAGVAVRRTLLSDQACAGSEGRLLGAWDPAVRSAIEVSFLASGRPYAADTFRRAAAALDAYTVRWTGMRKEACEATSVRHEQSEALLDLRMQCLDHRLGALRALTALLARKPDGDLVDRAVIAIGKLDDIASCADADAVTATAPLPADPAARIEIAWLGALLHEVHALDLGGKYGPALAMVRPVVAEADRIAYLPVELEAYGDLSGLQEHVDEYKGEEASIHRQLELAALLKDDQQIARAWIRFMRALVLSDHADEALAIGATAEVAVARAGGDVLRGRLLSTLGEAHEVKGDYGEAEKALRQGIALIQGAPEHEEIDLAPYFNFLGVTLQGAGKYAEAHAAYGQAIDIWERRLGADHPYVAGARNNVANLLQREGKYEEARALMLRSLAVFEGAFGHDGAPVAIPLTSLGEEELLLGRYEEAALHLSRAIAIEEKASGPDSRYLAPALVSLGTALARLGRHDDAEHALERARAIGATSPGVDHPDYAKILDSSGRLAQLRGRCRDAIELEQRALAIYEKALSKDHPDLAGPLVRIGQCRIELGRPRDAAPFLLRAVALRTSKGGDPADLAEAQFALGRARWMLAHGDTSAVALVEDARAGFAALGPLQMARVVEVDRWLAARRAKSATPP
jgi:eukaryotic-like serine/threonine-protein kinase